MFYQPKPRTVDAFLFSGRNGGEAVKWADLPGGQLTYLSSKHRLHYAVLASPTKWAKPEVIKPDNWLVKDGTEFYALTTAQFQARFLRGEEKDKRQGKLLVDVVPTTEEDDAFALGFTETMKTPSPVEQKAKPKMVRRSSTKVRSKATQA